MSDPFAISLGANTPGKLAEFEEMGHIPREISRFCYYFINYGGKLEVCIRNTKYGHSPVLSEGLEIPISLVLKIGISLNAVFQKVENFIEDYYLEPEKLCPEKDIEKR